MTDFNKLKGLFDEWKVPCAEEGNAIILEAGNNNTKVTGYNGFVTYFNFTGTGEFHSIGIWE